MPSQEGLTFGNLKFQGERSRLGLRKGWREEEDLDIDREGVATYSVGAADSEPAETRRQQLAGPGTPPNARGGTKCKVLDKCADIMGTVPGLAGTILVRDQYVKGSILRVEHIRHARNRHGPVRNRCFCRGAVGVSGRDLM